jgi:anti-sigma B factor antagonist
MPEPDTPPTPGSSEAFATEIQETGGIWLIRASGDIDLDTAPKLEAVLSRAIDAAPSRVIVELRSVTFLDSTGLRVLVDAERRLSDAGGALVIDGMSEAVRRVLEVTGLLADLADRRD